MNYIRKYSDGPIGMFYNNGGHFPNFYHRRYFRHDAREAPPSIGELILPRLNNIPDFQRTDENLPVTPPRSDLLLPPTAPGCIFDIGTLIKLYDATPPIRSEVMVEVKISLTKEEPAHQIWEQVRSFAMNEFALKRSLSAVLVMHRPDLAGSNNPRHVHILIPARELTIDGFSAKAEQLGCADGHRAIWEAWCEHVANTGNKELSSLQNCCN